MLNCSQRTQYTTLCSGSPRHGSSRICLPNSCISSQRSSPLCPGHGLTMQTIESATVIAYMNTY
ncbi:hypothetical protein GALMADRAFT_219057 [Galerina marginata CBS 339.88]|uniref:Uncharacterized protein n=1 Tax=Galerina marginata (strain CBS 339.88) TaxID=685588 RepID=A0A067TS32_GALM3|nr:hypothetical protein GALMADRAFT_219057 [Galerina marginata CBS 339.88]